MEAKQLTDILILLFENTLMNEEIPLFRGAIINSLGNKLILFHNHDGKSFRFSYPLIQYKRIHGKAAILCINQGTEEIGELFSSKLQTLQVGDHSMLMKLEKIRPLKHRIQVWEQLFSYRICRWIPLNTNNYEKYLQLETDSEKKNFLENILTGNILSFAKGLGIRFEKKVICSITDLLETNHAKIKGVHMLCFDAHFKCNVSIPNFIGLGKHVSINYGVVTSIKKGQTQQ